MGRWTIEDAPDEIRMRCNKGVITGFAGFGNAGYAALRSEHNADCDAYEARIAELEALVGDIDKIADRCEFQSERISNLAAERDAARQELARVKAESLRVVESGPVCELQDCITEYCFIESDDRLNVASEFAKRNYPTIRVKPITLERWETEE